MSVFNMRSTRLTPVDAPKAAAMAFAMTVMTGSQLPSMANSNGTNTTVQRVSIQSPVGRLAACTACLRRAVKTLVSAAVKVMGAFP